MTASFTPLTPDPNQALLRQIEPLLEVFDFARVRQAMVSLGWTYTGEISAERQNSNSYQ